MGLYHHYYKCFVFECTRNTNIDNIFEKNKFIISGLFVSFASSLIFRRDITLCLNDIIGILWYIIYVNYIS
jgi:hypothetical protein